MPERSINPSELSDAEIYHLLVNLITPRPIALVSTISNTGIPNLAPFSYFQLGGSNPPSICFSPTLDSRGYQKDTLRNLKETEQFVVNLVTRSMVEEMNQTSLRLKPEESEWNQTCFTPTPSNVVKPPRVKESPAQLECRVFSILQHGEGPGAANYVVGEVVCVHLADQDLPIDQIRTIGRMGGNWYVDTAIPELFPLARPSMEERRQ